MTYTPAPSAYSSTPAQWADDWLTPSERRALRAEEAHRALTTPAAGKPLSVQPRARQTRRAPRPVQIIARCIAYALSATAILGLWYIACVIAAILSAP